MLKKPLLEALNAQINGEFYSAYLYLSMVSWFEAHNLRGFATWMRVQTQEENLHFNKFFDFVLQRGGLVSLTEIAAPPNAWDSPLAIFEAALEHERHITDCVHNLVDLARTHKDFATDGFLQWFVTEQVEEESNVDGIVQKLKLIGSDGPGLFVLDRELGTRVFVPPPAA